MDARGRGRHDCCSIRQCVFVACVNVCFNPLCIPESKSEQKEKPILAVDWRSGLRMEGKINFQTSLRAVVCSSLPRKQFSRPFLVPVAHPVSCVVIFPSHEGGGERN